MPIANPLIQGGPAAPPATPVAASGPADSMYSGGAGAPSASSVGFDYNPFDNTPINVGILVLGALGVLIAFKLAGFRFVVDAGVGSR